MHLHELTDHRVYGKFLFSLAAKSQKCFGHAYMIGSSPFSNFNTCCEAILPMLTLITQLCGSLGSKLITV